MFIVIYHNRILYNIPASEALVYKEEDFLVFRMTEQQRIEHIND